MVDINDLKRLDNENYHQYIWRVDNLIRQGKYKNWEEVTPIVNKYVDPEDVKGESGHRKGVKYARDYYESGVFDKMTEDEYFKELQIQKRELERERMKLQTEKLEYNRWLREHARDELFEEKVIEAIKNNINITNTPKEIPIVYNNRGGVLAFADSHFGKDFKIYGLFDEVINEYSPEIFYSRMENLYNGAIDYIEKQGLNDVHVYNLGDHIEGFIRNSQLWTLRYGAIDSAILFGNYMGEWLKKLSHKARVIYHQTDGNHDEFRLLDGKKNEHLCESSGKIVKNNIILRNKDNPNFKLVENKTGLIFDNIVGYNILGIHGEVTDLAKSIKDFSDIYDVRIDYIFGGHKHHSTFTNCGVRKGSIGVGSIVGSDDFSMRLRKSADATASFIIFEEGKGKTDEHTFVLN